MAECSLPSVSKIDLNQIEVAAQDLSVTSPTHPAVHLGNQIIFKEVFNVQFRWQRRILSLKSFIQIVDISNIPETMTPDLDMDSTHDVGQSSMFANYGDESGDQRSLGKYLQTLYKQLSCAAEQSNYMFFNVILLEKKTFETSHCWQSSHFWVHWIIAGALCSVPAG